MLLPDVLDHRRDTLRVAHVGLYRLGLAARLLDSAARLSRAIELPIRHDDHASAARERS